MPLRLGWRYAERKLPMIFMINLLPPSHKKKLQEQETLRVIVFAGIFSALFLVSFAAGLGLIRMRLASEVQTSASAPPDGVRALEELKAFQDNFSALSALYQKRILPSRILEKLSGDLPAGVSLTSFALSSPQDDSASVSFRGSAPSRESLSVFLERLKGDPLFFEIHFPLANFVTPGEFSGSAKVNQSLQTQ